MKLGKPSKLVPNLATSLSLLSFIAFTDLPTKAADEEPAPKIIQVTRRPPSTSRDRTIFSDERWLNLRHRLKLSDLKAVDEGFILRFVRIPWVRPIEVFTVAKIGDKISMEKEVWKYRGLRTDKGDPEASSFIFPAAQLQPVLDWQSSNDFWNLPLASADKSLFDGCDYLIECVAEKHPYKIATATNVDSYEDLYKILAVLAAQPVDPPSTLPPTQIKLRPGMTEFTNMQKQVAAFLDFDGPKNSNRKTFLRFLKMQKNCFNSFLITEENGKFELQRRTLDRHSKESELLNPDSRKIAISAGQYESLVNWLEAEQFWKLNPTRFTDADEKRAIYIIECRTEKHPYHMLNRAGTLKYESLFKMLIKLSK